VYVFVDIWNIGHFVFLKEAISSFSVLDQCTRERASSHSLEVVSER
jgi:hypothetical protein